MPSTMLLLVCLIVGTSSASGHEGWNYDKSSSYGSSKWAESYTECGSSHQSPIDIIERDTVFEASCAIEVSKPQPSNLQPLVSNNGHSVSFSNLSTINSIKKGPERYILDSFHFHWSQESRQGSEHLIGGLGFDAELHLVHYNVKYNSVAEAKDKEDGLAVLSFFLMEDEGTRSLPQQNCIKHAVKSVAEALETKKIKCLNDNFNLYKTLSKEFFCYKGSLTTPPCSEAVQWLINRPIIRITKEFLQALKTVKSNNELTLGNCRPTQNLNGRTVYRSFQNLK